METSFGQNIFRWLKHLLFLVIAAFITMMLASFFSTQRVIGALDDIGAETSLTDRLSMGFYDLQHFGSLYIIFVFLAFLIAFFAGGLLFRFVKFGRTIIYIVAGMTAMFVMLWAMEQVFFGVPIVGGARDNFGLLLQMLAGGIGGFVFAKLTAPKHGPKTGEPS